MIAREHKRKFAKERKRAQKRAKECKNVKLQRNRFKTTRFGNSQDFQAGDINMNFASVYDAEIAMSVHGKLAVGSA